jgi:hypothetical protein
MITSVQDIIVTRGHINTFSVKTIMICKKWKLRKYTQ